MGYFNRRKQEKEGAKEALGAVQHYTDLADQLKAKTSADLGTDVDQLMSQGMAAMNDGSAQQMMAQAARANRLFQLGVETPAVVRSFELGQASPLQGGTPARVELTVAPPGGEPYDATAEQTMHEQMASTLVADGRVILRVDPDDPQSVMVWATAPAETPAASDAGPAERIAKLEGLRVGGVISDAEFEEQKAKLLGTPPPAV
jgi:hypothetical protein